MALTPEVFLAMRTKPVLGEGWADTGCRRSVGGEQVHAECINKYDDMYLVDQTEQPTALDNEAMRIANQIAQEVDREVLNRLIDVVNTPTMRA